MIVPLMLLLAPAPALLPQESGNGIPSALKQHVRTLASDDLEGRRSGTASSEAAAYYIAGALAAADCNPAGEGTSWFQEFKIEMPPEPGDCFVRLTDNTDGNTAGWSAVSTLAISATDAVTGPVIDVGYGIVDLESKTNDMPSDKVKGKVVLMRRYTPAGPEAEGAAARMGNLRTKIRNAERAGAIAVILGAHPDDVGKGGEAEIPFDAARGTISIPVVTVNAGVFRYFEAWVAKGDTTATVQAEVKSEVKVTKNVLGILPGRSRDVIVIGAHYDHLGHGGQGSLAPGNTEIHNGADDNASGTAVVLELAELISARRGETEASILFALWGAEEMGLLGSQHWVEYPTVDLGRLLCNINLDMVGRLQEGTLTVGSHQTALAFNNALDRIDELVSEDFASERFDLQFVRTAGDLPGGGGSDHMSFHSLGIPAMFFFSGLHTDYHKPTDDWELLDYPRMAQLVRVLDSLLVEFGRDSGDFTWIEPTAPDPHSGTTMAGGGPWFGSIPDYGAAPEGGGMQLAGTSPGGPADKAGLMKGDVIKQMGDQKIVDIYDFMDALGAFEVGETIQVTIDRGGKTEVLPVKLSSRSSGQ